MSLSGKSLNAATSVGPGTPISPDTPKQTATMTVSTTGTPTYSIALEGSVDGESWFTLNSSLVSQTVAPQTVSTQHAVGTSGGNVDDERVCIAFRANLTSFSGGDSPTLTASIAIKE